MHISNAFLIPFSLKETLAIPPILTQKSYSEKSNSSPIGTKGAPCPP